MTDIFTRFQVWLPYVACNNLYMILALGTLLQVWTVFADRSAALIFTISITVGCTIGQYLIVWTDIAIIILIINVLIFLEEPFFGHGTLVWQKRLDPIIYQEFCSTGGCLLYTSAGLTVTKTTSGYSIVADDTPLVEKHNIPISVSLKRAKMCCIQCSYCTQMCPRYLTGHPLKPHMIMRKLAYAQSPEEVLEDEHVRQAMICSECGLCETYA